MCSVQVAAASDDPQETYRWLARISRTGRSARRVNRSLIRTSTTGRPRIRRLPGHAAAAGGLSKPRRSRTLWLSLLVLVLAVVPIVAAVLTIRADRPATSAALFTEPAVKTAIQNYLSALSNGDLDVIARNNLCGLYDGVKDRRSDQALARRPVTPSAGSSSRPR